MNKRYIFLGCLLLSFLLGYVLVTQKEESSSHKVPLSQESLEDLALSLSPLPAYGKLVYKAKFLGLPIGKFTIVNNGKTMLSGREVYHFELMVKTLPFFAKIFKTKDRYVSYMDTQESVVLRHEEYIKGGAFLESTVDFDYKNNIAIYKNFISKKEAKVKIPDKLLDIVSGGFYLTMLPLGIGDTVDLNVYADEKIYNYTGSLSSKIKVSVPHYGKQDAYAFKPELSLNGEKIKRVSAEIFFSATAPTKPIHAVLRSRFGNVNVVLVEGYKTL